MVERDLIKQPPPEDNEEVRIHPPEGQPDGVPVATVPTVPSMEKQADHPDSASARDYSLVLPSLKPPILEPRTLTTTLPAVTPLGIAESLTLLPSAAVRLETRKLETQTPEISQVVTPALPLSLPLSIVRPALQPLRFDPRLPEVAAYASQPAALRLPVSIPVRLEPRQMNQGIAFPVFSLTTQPSPEPVAEPDPEAEEEQDGTGAGTSVGLLEMMFEIHAVNGGSGGLLSGRPWVILAETHAYGESYEQFLLYLLAESLRCAGGNPHVKVPSRLALEEWPDLADRRLTFIQFDDKKPDKQRLLEVLQGLIGGRLSCVVLSSTSEKAEELENEISNQRLPGVGLCRLRLGMLGKEMLAQVLQKAFGYLPFPAMALLVDSFDNIAAKLEARVYEKLKKITDKRVNPLLLRGSPGGDEGEEHYLTKLYVAWVYRDKLVETEKQLPNSQAVADVFINGHGLYYEVETLYGTDDPIKKLNDTVSKYRAVPQPSQSEIREVRIVIPNFVALLHLSKLLRFERYLEQQDKRFSIWTLDLSKDNALHEKGLRRLREVAAELRKLTKPSATL